MILLLYQNTTGMAWIGDACTIYSTGYVWRNAGKVPSMTSPSHMTMQIAHAHSNVPQNHGTNSYINLRYLYSKVVLLYEKSVRMGIINWRIVVDEGSCLLLLVGKPVTTLTSCKLRKLITQRESDCWGSKVAFRVKRGVFPTLRLIKYSLSFWQYVSTSP